MTTIKKNFVEIVELLEANKDKPVKSILNDIIEICTSKKKAETIKRNDKGEITHIFCWYHKEWEEVKHFGKKSSSNSGFNTMCKQGVNQWTRQQTEYKKKVAQLVDLVSEGKIQPNQINDKKEEYALEKNKVHPRVEEKK